MQNDLHVPLVCVAIVAKILQLNNKFGGHLFNQNQNLGQVDNNAERLFAYLEPTKDIMAMVKLPL